MNRTNVITSSILSFACSAIVNAGDLPVVPGFTVEVYAELCLPGGISFDPTGILFVGNGGCGVNNTAPAWIRRISPGGKVVENYGESQIGDPDLVLVDTQGFIAEPGSVLVGSSPNIYAILPDQSIITAINIAGNFFELDFDSSGRLLYTDLQNNGDVFVTTGGKVDLLFTVPADNVTFDIDDEDNIYTFSIDGTLRIYSPDGSVIDDAFVTGLSDANGGRMAFAPGGTFGTDLYLTQHDSGLLYRIDPLGNVEIVGSGIGISHIAFGPDGALYLSQPYEDRILRISFPCTADLNENGTVDTSDLLILFAFWGPCNPICLGDLDEDGSVNTADLLILFANWGPCP